MIAPSSGKRPWTPRSVLRLLGLAALAVAALMAFYGVYGIDHPVSARFFFIYWTTFFVLLLGAVAIAVLDTMATIFKFRKEHVRLRKAFSSQLHGKKDHSISE